MKRFFIILCVLGFFSLYGKEEVKKQEITISYIEGDVEVLLVSKKDWESAKLFGKLKEGDRIRTKLQSKAELKLPNNSTINIGENSIMDIKELFQEGLTEKSSFKLLIGNIKARFQRLKTKDSEVKFYTPTAVMGLRGTIVCLFVDWEGKTRASFEEGDGYIYSDKEGERAIYENQEAEVSLEGDIVIKALKMKTVPPVVGKSLQDAKEDIIHAGLNVGEIRAEESTQPPELVLSQYPHPGEKVLANTNVSLVIAISVPLCVVPDVIGLSKQEAEARISEAGLTLGVCLKRISDEPPDMVLNQRPNPNTEVKGGSPVDLIISKGPLPKVIVPSLIGETIERAREILGEIGIYLSGIILKKESIIVEEGRIVEQDPIPGTPVDLGSFIRVKTAIPPIPPSEKPPIPIIHYNWTIPGLFVREIPTLVLKITTPPSTQTLFINIMGHLEKLERPPYILNFKPPVMKTGTNEIPVSCWFENQEKVSSLIPSPYYDPIPPQITIFKLKRITEASVRVSVEVKDEESGIKNVKIKGMNAGSPIDSTKEKRGGIDVDIRAIYEKIISLDPPLPATIPINIEVEDNAGNKRTRIEKIPDVPPYPKNPSK